MILPLSSFGAGTYVHPERVDIGAPKRPERLKTKGIGQKEKEKNKFFPFFRLCFTLLLWFLAVCSRKAVTKVRPLCECTPLAPYASRLMSAQKKSKYALKPRRGRTLRSRQKQAQKKKIRQLSKYQAKSLLIQRENRIFVLQLREEGTLKIAAFSTRLSAMLNL